MTVALFAQGKPANEGLTRLAVLPFSAENVTSEAAIGVTETVRKEFSQSGMYHVLSQDEMEKRAAAEQASMVNECHVEKCAQDAGEVLAVTKVVLGELSMDGNLYVMKLKLFGLDSRNFESRIIVASECPKEKLNELTIAGVMRLRGLEPQGLSITLVKYRGKEVNHKLEWGIAGGSAVAAAVIWGMASGALSPSGDKNADLEVSEYDLSNPAYERGAFVDLACAARPHGMGGAFIGLSDDANAMAYNPAGMVRADQRNVTAGFMNYRFGYGSYPYFYSGYVNKITRTMSHGQALLTSGSDEFGSTETQVITSFAKLFDEVRENWLPFSIGINLKFLMLTANKATNEVYAWQDNAVEGGGFGASVDIGTQIQLTERITAAILLKDLVGTISYTNTTTGESYKEGVPTELVIGGHYRVFNTLNLVMDGNKSLYTDTEDLVRLGLEKWFFNVLAIRLGMSQNFAMDSHRRYHMGAGLNWEFKRLKQRVGVDYSYEYFPMESSEYMDLSGAQRFALNYAF